MKITLRHKTQIKRIVRFLVSGGSAAAVEFFVFMLLLGWIDSTLVANSISFLCGLMVSFTLNRKWVFDSQARVQRQFIEYFILAIINMVLSGALVYLLVDIWELAPWAGKVLVMGIIACNNYILFSRFIFKK